MTTAAWLGAVVAALLVVGIANLVAAAWSGGGRRDAR